MMGTTDKPRKRYRPRVVAANCVDRAIRGAALIDPARAAEIMRGRVVLPRAHYLAVCGGARPQATTDPATAVSRPRVKPVDWKPRRVAA